MNDLLAYYKNELLVCYKHIFLIDGLIKDGRGMKQEFILLGLPASSTLLGCPQKLFRELCDEVDILVSEYGKEMAELMVLIKSPVFISV